MDTEPGRDPAPSDRSNGLPPDDGRGDVLIQGSWAGTAIYSVLAVLALVATDTFKTPLIIACSVLFVIGLVAMVVAYLLAVQRSREDAIGIGGLYFVAGCAPRRVTRNLMGSFALQVSVAVVTASIGLSTVPAEVANPLAFGTMVPLYGLGLAGLWGARFGTFPPRSAPAGGTHRGDRGDDQGRARGGGVGKGGRDGDDGSGPAS